MTEPAVATAPEQPQAPAAPLARTPGRFEIPQNSIRSQANPPEQPPSGAMPETPSGEPKPETPSGATPENQEAEAKAETPEAQDDTTEGEAKPKAEPTDAEKQQRRVNRAYRKAAEAEARAKLLESELAKARSQPAPTQAAQQDDAAPRLEQFDDIEKFADAKAKYAVEQDRKAREQEASKKQAEDAQTAQRRYVESVTTAWDEKAGRGEEKYSDWAEKVGDLKPTAPFVFAIMEAENGHDIAHHLGSNPAEAKRIAALPPASQIREIGKLEARLAIEAAKPKPKPVSKAPAPITPVAGTSEALADAWKPGDSHEKFLANRYKELGRPIPPRMKRVS